MYAVFATGGKQYRATTGDILKIEKLDAEKGANVELDQVLMVGEGEDVKIGTPYLKGGKVSATIVEHGRGEKIKILKFKRRKHHMKRMGHRQDFTRIEITGIAASAPKKVSKAKAEAPATETPKAAKPKVATAKATTAAAAKAKPATAKAAKPAVAKAKAAKPKAKAAEAKAKIEDK